MGSGLQEADGGQGCGDRVRDPIARRGGEGQEPAPPLSALGKEPRLSAEPPDVPCLPIPIALCSSVPRSLSVSLCLSPFLSSPLRFSSCVSLSLLPPPWPCLPGRTCLSPPWPLPQRLPLVAVRAPSQGMTEKSFPWARQGVTASLQLAEQIARGWLGPHCWVCCRVWGSHGHAHEQGTPTRTSVGEPQAGHAGARTGAAPAKQEAPQEAADGPGRGDHAGGSRARGCEQPASSPAAGCSLFCGRQACHL